MEPNKKKILLISLSIGALGALGFLGYRRYMQLKAQPDNGGNSHEPLPEPDFSSSPGSSASSGTATLPRTNSSKAKDEFPLKVGSRGERVKQMQSALIAAYGPVNGGADGIFGKATEAALKKAGYSTSVDETTFNVIVGSTGSSFDPQEVAKAIFSAITLSSSLPKVIAQLKKLKSVTDYSAVNETFKNYRIGGVRKTLVNGLLSAFPKENDKQQIRIEFSRMGLKYDGKTWSLAGIDAARIITIRPSVVWKDFSKPLKVPANMVLGVPISEKDGYTLFQGFNNDQFLIQTSSIKYL